MSDEYRTGAMYGQSVTQAAAYWLGEQVKGGEWESPKQFWDQVLETADGFYKALKARQDALLVRTPLIAEPLRSIVTPTAETVAAAVAAAPFDDGSPPPLAPPVAGEWPSEEPPDEEVREGMASTGVGKHNSAFWDATDIRCPSCGKATLVKKTGEFGPDYQCSTKEQLKTERVNEKGKPVYVDVGPCAYTQWPARN